MMFVPSNVLFASLVVVQVFQCIGASYIHRIEENGSEEEKPMDTTQFGRRLTVEDLHSELFSSTNDSVDPKLGTMLTEMYQNYILQNTESDFGPSSPDAEEYISIDITFTEVIDKERARTVLSAAATVSYIECFLYMCSARILLRDLKNVASIDIVHSLQPVLAITDVGSVTSEGDVAMFSNIARSKYSVNGSGILIGVLSNSYNCFGGAATDIMSGDLPRWTNDILIVGSDLNFAECALRLQFGNLDEGRAMMQLIHDVAPGARLAFRASRGEPDFARGILELASAGCDVIVDDIFFPLAPMFQDGVTAQAADMVAAQGIPYFSSAGNYGRDSWVASSGFSPFTLDVGTVHQFGVNGDGSPITSMRISMPGDGIEKRFIFQWDEPYFVPGGASGSRSDLNVFFGFNNFIVAGAQDLNIGANPVEYLTYRPPYFATGTVTVDFLIVHRSGPYPTYMKLQAVDKGISFQFPTNSPTSYGHANAALAAGVGAAFYGFTPAFDVSPPLIQSTSSAGGTPIFFSKDGTRLSQPDIRSQPRFTGPDGGATTFFGDRIGGVFRFFGTSAAAPHVAAVAALMLEYKGGRGSLTPTEIYSTLEMTAITMDDPFTAGAGLVNASAALNALSVKKCGLFGGSFFCPLTGCGWLGRFFGFCRHA